MEFIKIIELIFFHYFRTSLLLSAHTRGALRISRYYFTRYQSICQEVFCFYGMSFFKKAIIRRTPEHPKEWNCSPASLRG